MVAGLIRTMRPHQWVKNLFVLAPLVFAKELFAWHMVLRSVIGFASFSLLASAVYILNDLMDVEADRAHPVKKSRPIASGAVSEDMAKGAFVSLVIGSLAAAFFLNLQFFVCVTAYLVLNLLYSVRLKRIAYVDMLCIALGFELRVLSGTFAAQVPASTYLLVVTFLLASFLGMGKRMHELSQSEGAHKQRASLKSYDKKTLTILLYVTAFATTGTYAAYTFDPVTRASFHTAYLPITTLFTLFGVLRFLHLVRGRPHAESPTEEMLRDKPFLLNLLLWAITIFIIIYVANSPLREG